MRVISVDLWGFRDRNKNCFVRVFWFCFLGFFIFRWTLNIKKMEWPNYLNLRKEGKKIKNRNASKLKKNSTE